MMRKRAIIGVCCVLVAASATTTNGIAGAETIDGKAMDIVRNAAHYLADRASFSFEADLEYELKFGSETERGSDHFNLAFRRPQQLSLHRTAEDSEIRFIANTHDLVVYIPEFRQYRVEEAPDAVSEIIEEAGYDPFTSIMSLLAEFVEQQALMSVLDHLSSATYVGREVVDGTDCNHVQISHPDGGWDLWIETGARPVIRRIVPDTSSLEAEMKTGGMDDARLSVEARLGSWRVDDVPDSELTFEAEEGVFKVARFQPPSPPMQLLGKPAPPFSLELLDGGTFDLAEAKGNEIVMLDFWATWCGPCRQAMPILEKVSRKFHEQGVRLYAVNLQEDSSDIRQYLKSEKLDLTVLLDKEASVAAQYKAEAIPQTVIIGKDGTVQVVHVGISPDLEAQVTAELSALVMGRKLAN
ncbi:MAG: redoxin domain-containing protein [Candidatus Hydrogenedentes bacterium]|nr:redoxin domain-containing protein [Candidatus Hydrogenedentota bacterium]